MFSITPLSFNLIDGSSPGNPWEPQKLVVGLYLRCWK